MMPGGGIFMVAGVVLVIVGLCGSLAATHPLRRILAVNIMGGGIFLLLVALADRRAHLPPDPVPHAMVLTGIVVAVSATAVALALLRRISASGRDDGSSDGGMTG
jgi:multicomponent Na+:H+ antiporter subunit C